MINAALKARILRAATIFREHRITQADIAKMVGASQPQVSRILHGGSLRATKLAEEICLYAERMAGGVTQDMVRANDQLVEAMAETWDGSAEHARALAIVIRSLANLRPLKAIAEGRDKSPSDVAGAGLSQGKKA